MDAIIYHNPRCSKSRATLELLHSRGVDLNVILYLEDRLDAVALAELAQALGLEARQMIRSGEPAWAALELNLHTAAPERLFQAMAEHPILIQRPIVVVGNRARIGRPPEAVLELFEPTP